MSERERWIVYPLLFLALGAALRDKLLKQTMAERIICSELMCNDLIVLEGSRPVARLRGGTLETRTVNALDSIQLRGRPIGVGSPDPQARSAIGQLLQMIRMLQQGLQERGELSTTPAPDGGPSQGAQPEPPRRTNPPPGGAPSPPDDGGG